MNFMKLKCLMISTNSNSLSTYISPDGIDILFYLLLLLIKKLTLMFSLKSPKLNMEMTETI